MKRRIFVVIDLPPELKRGIEDAIAQWRWLPIWWLAPTNWHITIVPPVYLENREVEVLSALAGRSRFGKPFLIRFSRVVLAPAGVQAPLEASSDRMSELPFRQKRNGPLTGQARMIWLEGDTPPELVRLKKKIEKVWGAEKELPPLKPESRPVHLHVTLARFEPGELKELESKTRTLGEVDFSFEANEVTVMESHLKPSGAEYKHLAAAPL
ncbi:MAG: hypothetical protein HY474_02005 [Candidatus Sungbacteria bacterium]|uniref:Phosphoesterase HXTX domain-containing protein n=1 Tax=Candidatus Sungiibacteriota bacterium TaxID=2750080 RepID=A0A933DRJ2_9BACT|nr:hypothetical protein [Candidatus Sungbacteria bacterium]